MHVRNNSSIDKPTIRFLYFIKNNMIPAPKKVVHVKTNVGIKLRRFIASFIFVRFHWIAARPTADAEHVLSITAWSTNKASVCSPKWVSFDPFCRQQVVIGITRGLCGAPFAPWRVLPLLAIATEPSELAVRNEMKASIVTPQELDADCIRQWEMLRATNATYASPFYSPHFALAVGEVRRDAQVAIIEQDRRIVGFLPFHRVRGRIAKPIGGHLNDYHGAILERGLTLAKSSLLQAAGLDAYDFDHLPEQFGYGLQSAASCPASPQMDLSGGYDACISAKGASWKRGQRDMSRKLRKMEREIGPIRFEFSSDSSDLFDAHVEMRNTLYRRMGLRTNYCTGWEGEVLRNLRKTRGAEFRSVLSVFFAGSLPVAAHFGLVSSGVFHWWFPAYDISVQRYSPGLQLIDHCARQSAMEGVSIIDFGKGGDRYKALFADCNVPMVKGSAYQHGSFAARARTVHATILDIAERILPSSINAYPRKSVERLWTGTALPRRPV
jgi:CelD/BcsL family acetyltransferase involved in cellulose biosynthesis